MNIVKALCAILLVCGASLQAADQDIIIRNIRQMALGGTSVAVGRDADVLHQNPAGLMNLTRTHVRFPRFSMGLGQDILDNLSDIQDIDDQSSESAQTELLESLVPMDVIMSFYASPISVSRKGFGAAAFAGGAISGKLKNPVNPKLELSGSIDFAPTVGIAREKTLFGKETDIGISVKYISRSTLYDKQTGSETFRYSTDEILDSVNNDEDLVDGDFYSLNGLAFDIGMLRPLHFWGSEGQWGLTVRNLGGSLSGDKEVNGETIDSDQTLPVTMTAGLGITKDLPFVGNTDLYADWKFMSPDNGIYKNLYFGAEKQVLKYLNLRGGVHQGYIVGGFGFSFYLIHMDYAYFVEELGEKVSYDPNPMHVFQIGFLF